MATKARKAWSATQDQQVRPDSARYLRTLLTTAQLLVAIVNTLPSGALDYEKIAQYLGQGKPVSPYDGWKLTILFRRLDRKCCEPQNQEDQSHVPGVWRPSDTVSSQADWT
jgi:hypothetical protein